MPVKKSEGSNVPVIVELIVDKGMAAAAALQAASQIAVPGFQLDTSYEPVPAGEPADTQLKADLEAKRQETVFVRGTIAEDKIKDLEAQPNVISVWRDTPIAPFGYGEIAETAPFVPPSQAPGQCPIPPCDCDHGTAACSKGSIGDVAQYLGVNQIWANGHKGAGIVVGVVDGGITAQGRPINAADTGHTPDASCPISWPNKLIPRVVGGWPTTDWGTTGVGWCWHGNMCATDALGMAPEAQLYDIRISAGGIQATISAALAGYQWAINQHKSNGTPHILTNSWGIYQKAWDPSYADNPNHPFTRKVVEAINEGICVLFAAGNCGDGCPSSRCGNDTGPGKSIWGANGHPMVMTVGAANIRNHLVGYSSQGPSSLDQHKPDFCSISHFTGFFSCDTGTSAACPIAAGVVALLKQCNPNLTQAAIKSALKDTAKNIGPGGWDQHSGSGIIQAKAAYDKVCVEVDVCARYLAAARTNLEKYRETQNRVYLCRYYQYAAAYYCCLYQRSKDERHRCLCYRYYAAHYQCLYQQSQNRQHLCLYYRYLAAYNCCLYQVNQNRQYLCNCYRYYAAYYQCLYQQSQNRQHLCLYYRYLAAYNCCLYQVNQNRQYLCNCYRYYAAYYQCLYQQSQNRQHLCLYYRYLAAYYCCLYQVNQNRQYLCNCYRYYATYYQCLYQQSQNRQHLCLYYRYLAAYYCCLYQVTGNAQHKALCDRYTIVARDCR
jgi:subtilisin family serine protease